MQKTVANDAVVLAVLDVGPPDGAMFNDPLAGDDLLQAVNRSGYQNERVANMPMVRQEGALRLRAAAREIAVSIGADHPHVQCHLAFAADSSIAAPTLGVAHAVGVVDADRGGLCIACVVGKVLH